jgi:hypothetical protein
VNATQAGLLNPYKYGRGYPLIIRAPTVAGNESVALSAVGRAWLRIAAVRALLTTGITVGARTPYLSFNDQDGKPYARVPIGLELAAEKSADLTWAMGFTQAATATAGFYTAPIPDIFIQPAHQMLLTVAGGLAVDSIAAVQFYAEEFWTGEESYPPGRSAEVWAATPE